MFSRLFMKSSLIIRDNRLRLLSRKSSTNRPSLSDLAKNALVYSDNDGYIMKSPYEPISIKPELTVDQYVFKNLAKWQNHVAIVCGTTGRKYTYAKLRDHCAALAIRLRKDLKLEKNDIVAICLPNVPEYPIAWLGTSEASLITTTVNPMYNSEEISRQFISSQPKAVFCLINYVDVVKKACDIAKQPNTKIIAIKSELNQTFRSDMINFTELMNPKGLNLSEASVFHKDTDYDDVTILPYSSGTTGMPKGVMLTHNNLTTNCEGMDVALPYERIVLPTTKDHQEILPCFLPFYHMYGLLVLVLSKLALGTKLISMPKYEINDFLRIVKDHKATILHLVPPVVIQLGNYEPATPQHFKHVRLVMSAASNLAQADADRFKKIATKVEFFQGYGLTETSPIATLAPKTSGNYATIGWPISSTEMKIVSLDDSSLKGLGPNETGEILVRGPNIMRGYYKNEEATNAILTEDGWLHTGDIGHYDHMGLFYVSDRLKELIKVNSLQVPPAELEGILREHPDVLDAVVIGIPNDKCGEVPKAFVVRRLGSKSSEQNLQDFVAKRVVKYKHLTGGVEFIEKIPKTATGKILRREIRKMFI